MQCGLMRGDPVQLRLKQCAGRELEGAAVLHGRFLGPAHPGQRIAEQGDCLCLIRVYLQNTLAKLLGFHRAAGEKSAFRSVQQRGEWLGRAGHSFDCAGGFDCVKSRVLHRDIIHSAAFGTAEDIVRLANLHEDAKPERLILGDIRVEFQSELPVFPFDLLHRRFGREAHHLVTISLLTHNDFSKKNALAEAKAHRENRGVSGCDGLQTRPQKWETEAFYWNGRRTRITF